MTSGSTKINTSLSSSRLYYYGARYYDPRTSVWLGIDPLSDKYLQWNPYNYTLDNPVKYVDKKGKNPLTAAIGALVGFTKEIVSQTISNGKKNLDEGQGFFHHWGTRIDWADVGISTTSGALAGLTCGASLLVTETAGALAKSAVDWTGGDPTPNYIFGTGEHVKNLDDASVDLAGEIVGFAFGKTSGLDDVVIKSSRSLSNSTITSGISGFFAGLFGIGRDEIKGKQESSIEFPPLIFNGVVVEE